MEATLTIEASTTTKEPAPVVKKTTFRWAVLSVSTYLHFTRAATLDSIEYNTLENGALCTSLFETEEQAEKFARSQAVSNGYMNYWLVPLNCKIARDPFPVSKHSITKC
jgi:hypothetical protein